MSLYLNTPVNEAMAMPVSLVSQCFECKAFSDWRKNEEIKDKNQNAVISRLNEVIKGLNIVAKVSNRRRW